MFEYNSRTHTMTENGAPLANGNQCYSGIGEAKNNPDMEEVHGQGPTPRGMYSFGQPYDDPTGLGRLVMHLDPLPGTDTFGRSAFRIHGDSLEHPGQASHGCIIVPHDLRVHISQAHDRIMKVY
jgi:hypothetical protein